LTVLYLISSLRYGGAEKQTVLDANMMVPNSEVIFASFIDGPQRATLDPRVQYIQIKKKNYLVTAINLARIVNEHNVQLIHSSLFASMIISALCSLFCRAKIVWHFHSHEYDLPVLNGLLYKWMGKLPAVIKILFVSNELRSFLIERFKFPISKTGILFNTSSVNHSLKTVTVSDKCTVGYIGRLVELKRVNLLIECAEYLLRKGFDYFQIVITGDGQERLNLEGLTTKNDLNKVVKFEGFQSDTERYYNDMDIFALPSGEECLSMAAIDAGVKGIPIVAFDVGGNAEIIDSGKTGFIVNTKEEFFERICYLVKNKNIREQMGKTASAYCSDKFGREKHLAQLNALYEGLNIRGKN